MCAAVIYLLVGFAFVCKQQTSLCQIDVPMAFLIEQQLWAI